MGFGGVAGFAMEAARLLFWVFIVLFVCRWWPAWFGADGDTQER